MWCAMCGVWCVACVCVCVSVCVCVCVSCVAVFVVWCVLARGVRRVVWCVVRGVPFVVHGEAIGHVLRSIGHVVHVLWSWYMYYDHNTCTMTIVHALWSHYMYYGRSTCRCGRIGKGCQCMFQSDEYGRRKGDGQITVRAQSEHSQSYSQSTVRAGFFPHKTIPVRKL